MIYREQKRSLLADSNSSADWEVIKRDDGKKQFKSKYLTLSKPCPTSPHMNNIS